jgi:hypothetical protein
VLTKSDSIQILQMLALSNSQVPILPGGLPTPWNAVKPFSYCFILYSSTNWEALFSLVQICPSALFHGCLLLCVSAAAGTGCVPVQLTLLTCLAIIIDESHSCNHLLDFLQWSFTPTAGCRLMKCLRIRWGPPLKLALQYLRVSS